MIIGTKKRPTRIQSDDRLAELDLGTYPNLAQINVKLIAEPLYVNTLEFSFNDPVHDIRNNVNGFSVEPRKGNPGFPTNQISGRYMGRPVALDGEGADSILLQPWFCGAFHIVEQDYQGSILVPISYIGEIDEIGSIKDLKLSFKRYMRRDNR